MVPVNLWPSPSQAGSVRLPHRTVPSEHHVTQGEIAVDLAQLATQGHPVTRDGPEDLACH